MLRHVPLRGPAIVASWTSHRARRWELRGACSVAEAHPFGRWRRSRRAAVTPERRDHRERRRAMPVRTEAPELTGSASRRATTSRSPSRGGFVQLNHGKGRPARTNAGVGDGFAWYSPRTAYPDGETCRRSPRSVASRATLIYAGRHGPEASCRFPTACRVPAREPAPIRPLIDSLTFIRSKLHWGAAFQLGHLRVPAEDFARIVAAMGRDFSRRFREER